MPRSAEPPTKDTFATIAKTSQGIRRLNDSHQSINMSISAFSSVMGEPSTHHQTIQSTSFPTSEKGLQTPCISLPPQQPLSAKCITTSNDLATIAPFPQLPDDFINYHTKLVDGGALGYSSQPQCSESDSLYHKPTPCSRSPEFSRTSSQRDLPCNEASTIPVQVAESQSVSKTNIYELSPCDLEKAVLDVIQEPEFMSLVNPLL